MSAGSEAIRKQLDDVATADEGVSFGWQCVPHLVMRHPCVADGTTR